jgi:bla regulator protein blaR1
MKLLRAAMLAVALINEGHVQLRASDTTTHVPFEVVSVRPTKLGDMISTRFVDNGISYTAVSTQILVRRAFGVEDDRIFGMPGWAKSDKYNIQARVSDLEVPKWQDLTRDQEGMALLPILTGRFNLKFHHETRVLPVYALMIAKNGPKFHEPNPARSIPKASMDLLWSGR